MLVWISAAFASDPAVTRYTRTALDRHQAELERARAIVALAEEDTDEADAALTDIEEGVAPDSPLVRVAVAARLQNADLRELALESWPDWAHPLLAARIDEVIPEHCGDPDLRTLPLPADRVVAACRAELPPEQLAEAAVIAADPSARERAALLLSELTKTDSGRVIAAVVAVFAWDSPVAWVGEEAALGSLTVPIEGRLRLATELVTRRLAVVQVGIQRVPPRLDAELHAVLAPELEAFGEPTQTIDWLRLLSATGADPAVVLARLGLSTDPHYTPILDENSALAGTARDALPLLAHRSPIVRARAAHRLEEDPKEAMAALSRAWKFLPGRSAPLRGDVGVPSLDREPADALAFEQTLVHWAHRSSRQNDDRALRATLWFVTCPATTSALSSLSRQDTAQSLLKTARHDPNPDRQMDLLQAMDAVLRRVPFEEGSRPAPEEARVEAAPWRRMVEP